MHLDQNQALRHPSQTVFHTALLAHSSVQPEYAQDLVSSVPVNTKGNITLRPIVLRSRLELRLEDTSVIKPNESVNILHEVFNVPEDKQEIGLKDLMEDDRDIPKPLTNRQNKYEEEVEIELGESEDLTPGEVVYDDGLDDAGNLFDFDDDL